MKTKTKILVAALTAAGLVAPLQQAWADTITGPIVHCRLERVGRHDEHAGRLEGGGRGDPGATIDRRHLTKDVAGASDTVHHASADGS